MTDEALDERTHAVCDTLFANFEVTNYRFNNVRAMLRRIDQERALEAVNITVERFPVHGTPRLKYWCGVCWRMLRETPA